MSDDLFIPTRQLQWRIDQRGPDNRLVKRVNDKRTGADADAMTRAAWYSHVEQNLANALFCIQAIEYDQDPTPVFWPDNKLGPAGAARITAALQRVVGEVVAYPSALGLACLACHYTREGVHLDPRAQQILGVARTSAFGTWLEQKLIRELVSMEKPWGYVV